MKTSRIHSKWASLYIMAAVGMAALLWEESLKIGSTEHKILAIAIILLLGFLIIRWIGHHQENFIDEELRNNRSEYYLIYPQKNIDDPESKK